MSYGSYGRYGSTSSLYGTGVGGSSYTPSYSSSPGSYSSLYGSGSHSHSSGSAGNYLSVAPSTRDYGSGSSSSHYGSSGGYGSAGYSGSYGSGLSALGRSGYSSRSSSTSSLASLDSVRTALSPLYLSRMGPISINLVADTLCKENCVCFCAFLSNEVHFRLVTIGYVSCHAITIYVIEILELGYLVASSFHQDNCFTQEC